MGCLRPRLTVRLLVPLLLTLLLLLTLFLVSCGKSALTLTLDTNGQGTAAKSPDATSYAPGTEVTLTATPADGWYFWYWDGVDADLDIASVMDNPHIVVMNRDIEATAVFDQAHALIINIVGKGDVSRSPDQDLYAPGVQVTLTATPKNGWAFDRWEGYGMDVPLRTNPWTTRMWFGGGAGGEDLVLTAYFVEEADSSRVAVPDLVYLDVNEAETVLTPLGLTYEVVHEEWQSAGSSDDYVIYEQDTAPGTMVATGYSVGVSIWRFGLVAGNYIGLTEEQATQSIEALGRTANVVNATASDPADVGKVLAQNPAPGTPLNGISTITITVGETSTVTTVKPPLPPTPSLPPTPPVTPPPTTPPLPPVPPHL